MFSLQEGASLMWWACYHNETNLVLLLLDSGANVDLPTVSKFTVHLQYEVIYSNADVLLCPHV